MNKNKAERIQRNPQKVQGHEGLIKNWPKKPANKNDTVISNFFRMTAYANI